MKTAPQELLKEYVKSQQFTSTAEIMNAMKEKITALYSCGMSQRDILVTKITEKIMPKVTAWQNRPLETVYPFIFMATIP